MFFGEFSGILRVIVVTPLIYAALILFIRVAGKRSLASLNAFDMLVTVALGSLLATTAVSADLPMAEGAFAIAALLFLQWLVTRGSVASGRVRNLVRASPRYLVKDGKYLRAAADEERVTLPEVEEAMRKSGYGRFDEVRALILETDGSFSVIGTDQGEPDAMSEVRL